MNIWKFVTLGVLRYPVIAVCANVMFVSATNSAYFVLFLVVMAGSHGGSIATVDVVSRTIARNIIN